LGKNVSGQYKKEKKDILNILDTLDKKAETCPLETHERDYKQYLNNRLAKMLREEEIKWYQRAKVKELLKEIPTPNVFSLLQMGSIGKLGFFSYNMRKQS
jgi:uncharacterized coiled-coil DUF342 family protein